ncbi:MAG: helix-turn-helix domain-containing protein [Calditrichaceae bacterium]
MLYANTVKPVKQKEKQSSISIRKKPVAKIQSQKKKTTIAKSLNESGDILDWLATQKAGANINQIADYLNEDTSIARRLVKQLMDEGLIEKVHQKYFFLSKRKNK